MNTERISQIVLQIADSAFPIGGFAHSNGLESAMKWGVLKGDDQLPGFFRDCLVQVASGCLPLVRAAHRGGSFQELDLLCDSFLNNHVANRASCRQGQALLNSARAIFPFPELDRLGQQIRSHHLPGHFAPVFGCFTCIVKVEEVDSVRLFLFMTLRSLVSSAVRLGLVGPLRGQSFQYELGPFVEDIIGAMFTDTDGDQDDSVEDLIVQTAPLIDLLQATHDRVYSRLFQS